ncbi:helix-turn-helix domain-containing protein [Methylosinus sp. Sm6]|uniref:helix-turn-helix domain-containing protein n=1 Tax=Methylosinus sp. Sm6 TaxID=2866948 RepID=UPI001C992F5B|nr:helix-turn-helix domain-containing protein [Methylosinus sp. Sm6]MBY6242826.1 helix-turn-helix domain-containing protein [Methylosinus sp. Sm6]
MSLEALTWAKKIAAPSSGAKYLLIMLANYAGKKGESFYPLAEIAADMQVSVDSVRRRLGELQDARMVARIARLRGDGSRSSDVVILLMDDETRAYAEALGWSAEGSTGEEADRAETPGIEPLADCEGVIADCDHPLPKLQGGGRTVATPKKNQQLTDIQPTPTPAARGGVEVASLREEAQAAEGRWKAFKDLWPFEPAASPGKARSAFFALSAEDREHAIRFAPRYLAATEGKRRKHPGNWLADRDWSGFLDQEREATAARERVERSYAERAERERAKYGGVIIYPDSEMGRRQHAAWRRYDTARGVDCRREMRSFPLGHGYVRPSRFPPSAAAEAGEGARDGPDDAAA